MGTRAVIGLGDVDKGWFGTHVGYDGDPETLGPKILNLVLDHAGDLAAAWDDIVRAPLGWRHAFTEPYEEDWDHYGFEPRRRAPALLRHSDPYVTGLYGDGELHLDGPEYWYLIDTSARTLHIYEAPGRIEPSPPGLLHLARFDAGGHARFDAPASEPLEWTNRCTSSGSDEARATAARVIELFNERLPIEGKHLQLMWVADKDPTLPAAGLVVPMIAYASFDRPLSEKIDEIAEHDQLLLLPRRVLGDCGRCEVAVKAALTAIERCVASGQTMSLEHCEAVFANLFPMDLLDLQLDHATLARAIDERVTSAFQAPRR
jgi:hypothetical protein